MMKVVSHAEDSLRFTPSFLLFMCTKIKKQNMKGQLSTLQQLHIGLSYFLNFNSMQMKGRRQGEESSNWNTTGDSSSLRFLMLLTDALLPGMLSLVFPVAVRGVEDPTGQWDGLRLQLLLRDAALSQVGFRWDSWRLRPTIGDVVRTVSGCMVMRRRPMGVAVHPGMRMSMRVGVWVWVWGGAAVVKWTDWVHGVNFWSAIVDVQIRRGHVLLRRGPQVARKRLQGIIPDRARIWILASEVTLAQGRNTTAGAAWQGGVTAPQSWLRTGGRARNRVERRLKRETDSRCHGCISLYLQWVPSVFTTTDNFNTTYQALTGCKKSQQLLHHHDIFQTLRHLNMRTL